MDFTTIKYHKVANGKVPILECKREFPLPHKFPSMTKQRVRQLKELTDCNAITIVNTNKLNSPEKPKSAIIGGVQKLRIKSRDGKDLGEVKVHFLSGKHAINAQNISLNVDSNKIKHVPIQGSEISHATQSYKTVQVPISGKLLAKVVPLKTLLTTVNADESNNNSIVSQSNLIKERKEEQSAVKEKKVLPQQQHVTATIKNADESKNTPQNVQTKEKKKEFYNVVNKSILPQKKYLTFKRIYENKKLLKNDAKTSNFGKEEKEQYIVLKVDENKKLSQIISKTSKLAEEQFSNKKNSGIKKIVSTNRVLPQYIVSKPAAVDENKKVLQNVLISPAKKELNKNNRDIVIIESPEKSKENVTNGLLEKSKLRTVRLNELPINAIIKPNTKKDETKEIKQYLSKTNNLQVKETNINTKEEQQNPIRNERVEENDVIIICEEEKLNEPINSKMPQEKTVNSVKLVECLDMITRALSSVKDDELRTKALRALAECGISKSKLIPTCLEMTTVHDSQIQTEVFGLLDEGSQNFVLVREKASGLERIKQVQRSSVVVTQEMGTQTEKRDSIGQETQTEVTHSNKNKLAYSNFDTLDLLSTWDTNCTDTLLNIDDYLKDVFSDNTEVVKVKQTLSVPHGLCKRVSTQLEEDLKGLQEWDEDGMLNIHRAVADNQIKYLQRILMVLKASKISIDVLTRSGETSLELAIKHNALESVVKLLIDAGAKPVSEELLCDNAIILASRSSSPLLQFLLTSVTEKKLLNYVDSKGFAPLHYCALNGYLDGVKALIEHGADVNLKDNRSGRSPFFHALENNHMAVAQKLLECGANADQQNFAGQSILSIIDEDKIIKLKSALSKTVT